LAREQKNRLRKTTEKETLVKKIMMGKKERKNPKSKRRKDKENKAKTKRRNKNRNNRKQ